MVRLRLAYADMADFFSLPIRRGVGYPGGRSAFSPSLPPLIKLRHTTSRHVDMRLDEPTPFRRQFVVIQLTRSKAGRRRAAAS